MKVTAYLDCDSISAMEKKEMLLPEGQAALETIERAIDAGQCEISTSVVTAEEIAP